MSEHGLPFAISPGNENIKEVFGYFHHQLNQISNDVAVLTKRVAALANDRDNAPFSAVLEAHTKRIDDLTVSLQSVTNQVTQQESFVKHSIANLSTTLQSEFSDKLLDLGIKVKESHHRSETAKQLATSLDARVTDTEAKSTQAEKELLQLRTELAELKKQNLPPAILTPIEPLPSNRSRSSSPRRKHSTLNHIEIVTFPPSPDIFSRVDEAKSALIEIKSTQKLLDRVSEYDQKFAAITDRLDEFATKSDLYAVIQGFIASGADGVAECAARARLSRPGQTHQLIIESRPNRAFRKRPFTTQPPK